MTALVVCRFVHFTGAMLAFGASAYLWLCAPNDLRRRLSVRISRLVIVASLAALISAIAWLALEAASMADDWAAATDPDMIFATLTDTEFGRVWMARLPLAAALVVLVLARPGRWPAITLLAGLVLASLALVGHAAMHTGLEGAAQRGNHAVHLLAAGAWLGGLAPFALSLPAVSEDRLGPDALRAMARFSFLGQFAVLAIVLTGIVNVALISGVAPIPPAGRYSGLLDAKLVLVGIMVGLAVVNRLWLAPRIRTDGRALRMLAATSCAEIVLGTCVVGLVSAFALLNPV